MLLTNTTRKSPKSSSEEEDREALIVTGAAAHSSSSSVSLSSRARSTTSDHKEGSSSHSRQPLHGNTSLAAESTGTNPPPVPIVTPTAAARTTSVQNSSNGNRRRNCPNNSSYFSSTGSSSAGSPEVFLCNPRTGGFDCTPAQRDYQEFANNFHNNPKSHNNKHSKRSGKMHTPAKKKKTFATMHAFIEDDSEDESSSLNDSDIYTTAPLPPPRTGKSTRQQHEEHGTATKSKGGPLSSLLSPRSKTSFQRYFHTKAHKTPQTNMYIPPEATAGATTQATRTANHQLLSNHKRHNVTSRIAHQWKSLTVTHKSPSARNAPSSQHNSNKKKISKKKNRDGIAASSDGSCASAASHKSFDYFMKEDGALQSKATAHDNRNSRYQQHTTYGPTTLPTSQSAPRPVTPNHNKRSSSRPMVRKDTSSAGNANRQQDAGEEKVEVEGDDEIISSSFWRRDLEQSSFLDMSFSSLGNTTANHNSKAIDHWTFEAVSPVPRILCGKNTTLDDATAEFSACLHDSSGFDADNDRTPNTTRNHNLYDSSNDDTTTLDSSLLMSHDALSMQSSGAVLLTEAGLKRHNDKKLRQEQIEPLTLRQSHGAGKLEKVVLQQKVKRLQAKELKKSADASLEEERLARKRRQKEQAALARQQLLLQQQQLDGAPSIGSPNRSPCRTPDRRSSPPRSPKTPNSTSPQNVSMSPMSTPTRPAADLAATNNHHHQSSNNNNKTKSWFRRVLDKTKKSNPEALKQQWKEKERQRVALARQEKEEAEELERQRIETLRRLYLEKQRQLEAAAPATSKRGLVIDVDALIVSNQNRRTTDDGDDDDLQSHCYTLSQPPPPTAKAGATAATVSFTKKGPTYTAGASARSLGLCSICHAHSRSHIAMPCMHFAFCGSCVQGRTECPLCSMENVAFSKVNTE